MGKRTAKIRFAVLELFGIRSSDLETSIQAPLAERLMAGLRSRLNDAWLRGVDVRVARDVRTLDHSGVLADFERAARSLPVPVTAKQVEARWPIRDSRSSGWVPQGCDQEIAGRLLGRH